MCELSKIHNCNVQELLNNGSKDPDFVIDGVHFGRGDSYVDQERSIKLKHLTQKVTCWLIVNQELRELDNNNNNFYDGETYLIRWIYVTETVHLTTDKVDRTGENAMYFYWRGVNASKSFSPLPEELAAENPPVERLVQWAEPPIFLRLFSGRFVAHRGKDGYLTQRTEPRLYILRAEIDEELHLYEVPCTKESLRSRTSFLLVEPNKLVTIWHGNKSSLTCRTAARTIGGKVFGDLVEVYEGAESASLLNVLEGKREDYCYRADSCEIVAQPRLFYFNDITGDFLPTEVEISHKSQLISPLPFLQSHLYSAAPPAIFLLDDGEQNAVWIWQRHKTQNDEEFGFQCNIVENIAESYAQVRSIKQWKVVIAGLEPLAFTNLFPSWLKNNDVAEEHYKMGFR